MRTRSLVRAGCLLATCVAAAAPPTPLGFEEAVRLSDRIVIGTVLGTGGGSVRLPDGREIALGMVDPSTGLVFTPYRIRVTECLFDGDGSCRPGESEILLPGGTVHERVEGRRRLRTWEVAGAAGVPFPPPGESVLLFLSKWNGRYHPLNDAGGRIRIDRSSGPASVALRFTSPRFLSSEGREAARARFTAGRPATSPPSFVESVGLDRLKSLILLAREVPTPTSGSRHAVPFRTDSRGARAVRQRRSRLRSGQVPQRRRSPLVLVDRRGSAHRSVDRGRPCGP